ncbi:hypothetical protein EV702DRAFT_263789 [Suillus placidus]|uniref:Uncharacterized protein n=1 Tax=Suillus placidus TaxID=48579 RepID=A0A9P7D261_9AGAM|nr:hypothetical protein EV702DRAFT_263789 [Suillus placidus]
MFTAVFIDQAFWNTLGVFEPNTTSPGLDWGQCLQCAAVDRAVTLRSKFCSQCFAQDCYNPSNLPSNSELPGRQFAFVNPDLGLQKVEEWLKDNKGALAWFVVAIIVVIAGIVCFIFWWRKRRARKSRYSRVDELREDDEP